MHSDKCFDVSTYKRMAAGQLPAAEMEKVYEHLETCDRCFQIVRSLPADSIEALMRKVRRPVHAAQPAFVADSAPKITSTAALMDALQSHVILEPAQLEEVSRSIQSRFVDARSLAGELLKRGWLSGYQANQLLNGRGADLVLGPYLLLERLGEGGMGQVFKARHLVMNRTVALKVIRKELLANPDSVLRFQREIRLAAQLEHPNLVRAYDAAQVGKTHFLVMEYAEGIDLQNLVQQSGRLPIEQASDYIRQAALGLQHAADRGIVHRDIKPSNLQVTAQGMVLKVLDMGLARTQAIDGEAGKGRKVTQAHSVLGTPDYMAPEQITDPRSVDIRADIYSLGCSFYFILAGKPPFPDGTWNEKLGFHLTAEPRPIEQLRPDVPLPLAAVLRKMMAKRPEDRYATAAEVAEALKPFCQPTGTAQPQTSPVSVRRASVPSLIDRPATAEPGWSLKMEPTVSPPPNAASPRPAAARDGFFEAKTVSLPPAAAGQPGGGKPPPGPTVLIREHHQAGRKPKPSVAPRKRLGLAVTGGLAVLGAIMLLVFLWPKGGTTDKNLVGDAPGGIALSKQLDLDLGGVNMKLVRIDPGTFMMGSPESEEVRSSDELQHAVKITRPFYMGTYEVTQEQYTKVTGKKLGTRFTADKGGGPNFPAEPVTWNEAKLFCKKLSELPEEKKAGRNYRLPTEAEWEYACRAGTTGPFHYGSSLSASQARINGAFPYNAPSTPVEDALSKVGSYQPNAWGLYDMHGNVWEWCEDYYSPDYYKTCPKDDPKNTEVSKERVVRGGGNWRGADCRSASRSHYPQDSANQGAGFRVVCEIRHNDSAKKLTERDLQNIETIKLLGGIVDVGESTGYISVYFDRTHVDDSALEIIKDLPNVVALNLNGTKITDTGLRSVGQLTSLERLFLHHTDIGNGGIAYLTALIKLKELDVSHTKVGDGGTVYLSELKDLQSLRIDGTAISDTALVHIRGLTKLRSLNLHYTKVTDAGLAHLKNLTQLESLSLLATTIGDDGLANIKSLTNMKELDLYGTRITDAGLANLRNMTRLVTVGLIATKISDEGLEQISGLREIRNLWLAGSKVSDSGMRHISGFRLLESLRINDTAVGDAGLAHIKFLTNLRELTLGRTITDAGLDHIKGLTNLTQLHFGGSNVTDKGLLNVKVLTNLKQLYLDANTRITDTGVEHLKGIGTLSHLSLNGTKITDAGVSHLVGLGQLIFLRVSGTGIGDTSMKHIANLTNLEELAVDSTHVTDRGLTHLNGLSKLRWLNLQGTKVTTSGLASISGMSKLQSLFLPPSIGDEGVIHIKGMANLRELYLGGTKVTDAGMLEIRRALPNCNVYR